MATADDVRRLALSLPETSEKPCYGTPGFYVRKHLFARLRNDGSVVVKAEPGERELLMAAEPDVFFITDHYRPYEMYVLVRLEAVEEGELLEVLTDSWRIAAPKRVRAAFDAEHPAL
jgi:hypothetical protein